MARWLLNSLKHFTLDVVEDDDQGDDDHDDVEGDDDHDDDNDSDEGNDEYCERALSRKNLKYTQMC